MATELSGIRRAIRDPESRGIAFRVTGVGSARVRASIRQVAESRPDAIVLLGFCGGADPHLAVGDLHLANCFKAPGLSDSIAPDPALFSVWSEAARDGGTNVICRPSATVDEPAGVAAKSRLYQHAGVASVNMEDYWAARAALDSGIPFVSVRAVLDDAATELPRRLPDNPDSVSRMLANLVVHPQQIPSVARLARMARRARSNLAKCALAAIESQVHSRPEFSAVPR